ncbi:sialate O-acetylesterase [Planctomycetota bacterium]
MFFKRVNKKCRVLKRTKQIVAAVAIFSVLGLATVAQAEFKVASFYSDHVVLQQGIPLGIWGTGDVGSEVTLRFAGQIVDGRVTESGTWRVQLEPLQANAQGKDLIVSDGHTQRVIHDVLVGEVWLAAGQSNMQMTVQSMVKKLPAAAMIEAANPSAIRCLRIDEAVAGGRRADFERAATWKVCDAKTVSSFSAVAWLFARRLHMDLNVPVGIIDVSWGGKPIEPFIPDEDFQRHPLLQTIKKLADQDQLDALAKIEGGVVIRNPEGYPGAIYNARIRPMAGCGLRGFIWYQAESNCGTGEDPRGYRHKMEVLVDSWRRAWGNPDLPFYFVQLPKYKKEVLGWIYMRDEQRRALAIANTGMAVTIDTGSDDVHPGNKVDVAQRLALLALNRTYHKPVVDSGPLYQSHIITGPVVTVTFSHAECGLMVASKVGLAKPQEIADQTIPYFELAGADGQWFPAQARIVGKTVQVSSQQVSTPQAVRYACLNQPQNGLLYNREGLPASPFCSELAWLPWRDPSKQ